jgi:hypothetical protein
VTETPTVTPTASPTATPTPLPIVNRGVHAAWTYRGATQRSQSNEVTWIWPPNANGRYLPLIYKK